MPKVKALTSFVGHYGKDRATMVVSAGDEFDLPEGVDWLTCGFCEEIQAEPPKKRRGRPRQATRKTGEKATGKAVKND